MRIFHLMAFEGYAATGQAVYSSPSLSELFGSVDRLYIGGYTSEVTGTLPTLQIQEQISLDGENWTGGWILVGIPGDPIDLNIGSETLFQGGDNDPDQYLFGAKGPFRRLQILVGGTGNANAMVRVWATGRDRSRRARALGFAG